MKLRTYLGLFGGGATKVLLLCCVLMSGVVFGVGAAIGRPITETGRFPLFFAALFVPVFSAIIFALPACCPGIALLPGAQRGLLRWHAVLIGTISIPSGMFLHLVYPVCPLSLAMILSAAYLSYFLTTNPTRSPFGAIYAAPFFLLTLFVTDLASRLFEHPAWSGGIALAFTAGCFFRASSGAHRQRQAGPTAAGLPARRWWQREPKRASLVRSLTVWRNLQAVHHGRTFWWMLAIGAGTIPLVFSILAVLKSDAGGFVAAIHHLITNPAEWQLGSPGFFALLILSTPYAAKGRRLPPFVPLSRSSMAVITLTSSFLCLGAMLAASTATMLAVGFFTGQATGQSMTGTMTVQIVLSSAIWLAAAPLLNPWTMGNHGFRVGIVMFTALLNQSGQKVLFYWGPLPAGIVCAVLTGFTHLAYYFELKRRFATRDLVDLGPEARMQPTFGGMTVN